MVNCEGKILQIPISALVDSNNNHKHDPNVLSGFTEVCWSTLSGCRVPPVRSARTAPKPLVAWKRGSSGMSITPCEFPTLQQSGVVGRDDCTMRWALTSRRSPRAARRRSRVSQSGCTHAQETGQQTDYRYSHGDRPHMAIADVHHICHIGQIKCTRKHDYQHLRVPSSHVRNEAENA